MKRLLLRARLAFCRVLVSCWAWVADTACTLGEDALARLQQNSLEVRSLSRELAAVAIPASTRLLLERVDLRRAKIHDEIGELVRTLNDLDLEYERLRTK